MLTHESFGRVHQDPVRRGRVLHGISADGARWQRAAHFKMQLPPAAHDLGFTYRVRKSGDVEIFHWGRLAATLRGNVAEDFKQEAGEEVSAEAQQLMARVTGNYKHRNERKAMEHPRNRR